MGGGTRNLVTVTKYSRDEALEKLSRFNAEVYSANWADYLYLVYNVPFWEAEYEHLQVAIQPYIHEAEVGAKYRQTQELLDVMYKCEDVRDHINELCEVSVRATGFMGTGYNPHAKCENMQENAELCSAAYDKLLEEHPDFKPKIEQTVGHGLATLRHKHKFKWST